MAKPSVPTEKETQIRFTVEITDGSFEASLQVPISYSQEQKEHAVAQWLKLIHTGIELGVEQMGVNLQPLDPVLKSVLRSSTSGHSTEDCPKRCAK